MGRESSAVTDVSGTSIWPPGPGRPVGQANCAVRQLKRVQRWFQRVC